MPELPEVETMCRDLQDCVLGLQIEKIKIYDDRVIKNLTPQSFCRRLKGLTFQSVNRRAKAIIISFDQGVYLVVQVKMTGQFYYGEDLRKEQNLSKTKVVFTLSNGKYLNYNDQRLFGWLIYTKDLKEISYLQEVGPEPLEKSFTNDWLLEALKKRRAPIKPLLMNQNFLAGVGNIYASEILFKSRISPIKPANQLTKKQVSALRENTVQILQEAVEQRGTSMQTYLDSYGNQGSYLSLIKVYGKPNQPCPVCGINIIKIVQTGRSTFYCSKCQK